MATIVSGAVGYVPPQGNGPNQGGLAMGRNNESVVTELHGKFYESSRRGFLWTATQAVGGVVATLFNATTASSALANPPGSGKGLSLVRVEVATKVLAGTPVLGFYTLSVSQVPNATLVTGTALTPLSGLVGNGATPAGKPFTTATLPVAPVLYRLIGGKPTTTSTTGALPFFPTMFLDFDGQCVLQPGTYASVGQDAADTTNATIVVTWIWEEVDL
jgi:hypothetical protein